MTISEALIERTTHCRYTKRSIDGTDLAENQVEENLDLDGSIDTEWARRMLTRPVVVTQPTLDQVQSSSKDKPNGKPRYAEKGLVWA